MIKRNYISDQWLEKLQKEYDQLKDKTQYKDFDDYLKKHGWKWDKKWATWYQ